MRKKNESGVTRDPAEVATCSQGHRMSQVSGMGYRCWTCNPDNPPIVGPKDVKDVPWGDDPT